MTPTEWLSRSALTITFIYLFNTLTLGILYFYGEGIWCILSRIYVILYMPMNFLFRSGVKAVETKEGSDISCFVKVFFSVYFIEILCGASAALLSSLKGIISDTDQLRGVFVMMFVGVIGLNFFSYTNGSVGIIGLTVSSIDNSGAFVLTEGFVITLFASFALAALANVVSSVRIAFFSGGADRDK